jgi:tetraacyldisaccharide 4'-kinase
MFAHERFGTDFFVLDDGFQHRALKRDLNLVLLDASSPFGNGRLLPWGPLREPVKSLDRADAFLMTRCGEEGSPPGVDSYLQSRFAETPLFRSRHVPDRVVFPRRSAEEDLEHLKGKRVVAFAGIAHPDRFRQTLKGLGAQVVYFRAFRDHHPYSSSDMDELGGLGERLGADLFITTEKDWVRMKVVVSGQPDTAYLRIRLGLLGREGDFFHMIEERARKKGLRRATQDTD